MKITFLGAARTVTGSCYLLEHNDHRFLVDCGLFQGSKELKELNYADFPFNPAEVEFMLLTHAHIDHCGRIPQLFLKGFKSNVFATSGTVDLAGILLPDCGHIQEMEIERKNRKRLRSGLPPLEPIYTAEYSYTCMPYFKKVEYEQEFSPVEGIGVILHDAGHILGSSMIEIKYQEDGKEKKLVFTGDLGRPEDFILNEPTTFKRTDFLVMESTYGMRHHEAEVGNSKELSKVINETFKNGGNVVIPAFAIDRTQDLILLLQYMLKRGEISEHSVYVDSPLAIKATEIFALHPEYYNASLKKLDEENGPATPFEMPGLNYSLTTEESVALNSIKSGAIIISASGMADAGRIKHHLKHNLWRKESSVVFIGYQAQGTLGRRILDGEKKVNIHGEEIEVNANIVNLSGFSAHADQDELLKWLSHFEENPKQVFVTHGEESSAIGFADLLHDKFAMNATAPSYGDVYDLEKEEFIPSVTIKAPSIGEIVSTKPLISENPTEIFYNINLLLQDLVKNNKKEDLQEIYRILQRK